MTNRSKKLFWYSTAFFWAVPALCGVLFWREVWDNMLASRVSLYAVGIWLNTCCLTDTLLALVWTQYQYVLFPAAMFYFSLQLLLHDQVPNPELERVYGS